MKFGQLIEHNIRNILLKKSYAKCGGDTIPRLFSKKSKLSKNLKFCTTCFIVCQVQDYQNISKQSYRPPAFTSYKAFLKNKKRSGTSLPA